MRAARLALLPLGIAFGLAAERHAAGTTWGTLTVGDFAAGCVLIVCGTLLWELRAESRVGALISLAGLTWFLGTYWSGALYLHRGPLVHVFFSYPTGRLGSRAARVVVAAAYVDGAIKPLGKSNTLTLVLCVAVAATALLLFFEQTGTARRASAPALAAALGFAAVLALVAVDQVAGWDLSSTTLSLLYDLVVAAAAIVLTTDLLRRRWTESVVTRLVVELGSAEEAGSLQARLAAALGDPTLTVGYRLPEAGAFVDETGRPVEIRAPGFGRAVTRIEGDGEEIAVLVHDDALVADPKLVDAVAAAARFAVANARLQAEARSHARELDASRRRIVEAGDAQSRRLETELRLGALKRLDNVAAFLSEARSEMTPHDGQAITTIETELRKARGELREFAHGIHPAALTDGGLMRGLELLAERSPVPVDIRGSIERLPPAVEAALFFVCSEALANVAKHASASNATVDVTVHDAYVALTVIDDGPGGADVSRGSGLTGLADRVEALGGRFAVQSPLEAGTRIVVDLPVET